MLINISTSVLNRIETRYLHNLNKNTNFFGVSLNLCSFKSVRISKINLIIQITK